ncbi:MAG TPA: hypothetical protein GXX34_04610 [Clostridia bacterium]|nr:hypothetical protein [Clostridia bacterium]
MQIGLLSLSIDPVFGKHNSLTWTGITTPGEIYGLDGLILAGSNIRELQDFLVKNRLVDPIREKAKQGMPVWGIQAGLYLMAKRRSGSSLAALDLMDGTAACSTEGAKFTVPLHIQALGPEPVCGIFDRFIYLSQVEPQVGIMAYHRERIVMARQGNLLVSAFRLQAGEDRPLSYFLQMVRENLD